MRYEPLLTARGTAKNPPPIEGIGNIYGLATLAADKFSPHSDGFRYGCSLPVVSLTSLGAEFRPPVCSIPYLHERTASKTMKFPQHRSMARMLFVSFIVQTVPIGITAACGTAIFLRTPYRLKRFTAGQTYSGHAVSILSAGEAAAGLICRHANKDTAVQRCPSTDILQIPEYASAPCNIVVYTKKSDKKPGSGYPPPVYFLVISCAGVCCHVCSQEYSFWTGFMFFTSFCVNFIISTLLQKSNTPPGKGEKG